ncbi:hypothetical protein Cantr_05011 [Candida viswanathii]|uniref:Zn(2)-C6 fungal-type domain-containing protein n=1 Tax=Candida viswanathii TaxID=5486 RepID=A0A367XTV3_9ASCO|nr:hypothetical protein Cantr_05011 [Candida viswanathii]
MSKGATQRRRHTNLKLGCLNCKRKKVRCDETLPQCKNCLKGKKETCSYLSLSVQEVEKIKLTHSLRTSQNKLLHQNYRLPTSSKKHKKDTESKSETNGESEPTLVSSSSCDVLEFKFELKKLPINIPTISYPPLQFNNSFVKDFTIGNMDDEESSSPEDSTSATPLASGTIIEDSRKVLPNGMASPVSFKCLNKEAFRRVYPENVKTKVLADLSFHVVMGKSNLLDHISDLILYFPPDSRNRSMLLAAFSGLGATILLNVFNKRRQMGLLGDNQRMGDFLNKWCLEVHGYCQLELQTLLKFFDTSSENMKPNEVDLMSQLVAYTSYLLNFINLLLNFGPQSYFNSSRGIFKAYEIYTNYIQRRNLPPNSTVKFLTNNIQYNIMTINVPSYAPQFLFEIESNLRSLEFIFVNKKLFEHNPAEHQEFIKISHQFRSLIRFFGNYVLPIVYESRDENFVSIYPPNTIYDIFKQWHLICPSEAMVHHRYYHEPASEEGMFLNDLTTTLYMYYYAIAAALDAVFPACKYLHSMSFMLPTTKFFTNKCIMTVNENNAYAEGLFQFKIGKLLQRHIFYASRLFSFFRRRFVFYHNNTAWENPFLDDDLKSNRFKSRTIKNSFEIPIQSFNNTLIRPEHYPTRVNKEKENGTKSPVYTREDDTMNKQLYARNIETLDFFDLNSILQYDFETMLLLRDYRPFDDQFTVDRPTLDISVIKEYYDDKTILLNNLH